MQKKRQLEVTHRHTPRINLQEGESSKKALFTFEIYGIKLQTLIGLSVHEGCLDVIKINIYQNTLYFVHQLVFIKKIVDFYLFFQIFPKILIHR